MKCKLPVRTKPKTTLLDKKYHVFVFVVAWGSFNHLGTVPFSCNPFIHVTSIYFLQNQDIPQKFCEENSTK